MSMANDEVGVVELPPNTILNSPVPAADWLLATA